MSWRSMSRSLSLLLLLVALLLGIVIPVVTGVPHLKVRRILLPYNLDVPTNYTLVIEHADGACFRWESSRTDVATVTPIPDDATDCTTRALVTAVSRSKKRQSSVIYAKESNGGPILTADVEVDSVHSIDIVTRTREIAMDAYPEEFEVVARNDQNNTFSCLDGIEFEWDLKHVTTADAKSSAVKAGSGDASSNGVSILRFRKAAEIDKESNYWEDRDRRGCIVHIEGVKTGTSRVIVRIKDPAYSAVAPSEIQLIVHARIDLRPADSKYLLPFAQLSYSVTILKNTQIKPLPLPSEQYYLEITDPTIASLDVATSTITALKEGSTSIVLRDRNIKAGIDMKPPAAEVTVTKPSYLMFYIEPGTPGKEWALQDQTFYTFTIEIFDIYHNRMFASPNLALIVVFPSAFFRVTESSSNGTYHVIQAIKQGNTKVKATLEGAKKPDGTIGSSFKAISLEQDISIYPALQVTPKSVFLPWDMTVKPVYSIKLSAKGATGVYRWDSGQASIASVLLSSRDTSNPRLVTKGIGATKVTVRDANNHVFVQHVPVEVTDVTDIDIIPGIVETQLDASVHVNIALYGRSKDAPDVNRLFDNCTEIPLHVDIVEKTRFTYIANKKPAIHPRACRALEFACIGVGHSRITVTYDAPSGPINSTTIISCFMPLKIVYPDPLEKGVLALGTSIEVAFEGGPRKWPNHAEKDYFADLNPTLTGIFDVREIVDPYRYRKDLHVYRVTCKSLGETLMSMRVGNRISPTLPNPAVISESLKLACSMPIELSVRPKMRKDDSCPKSFQGRKYPVSCKNPIEMEVTAWDVEQRKFLNISSLSLSWTLSDSSLAHMKSSVNFVEEVNGAAGFRKGNRNYQVIVPERKEGDLIVSLTASSYRPEVLRSEKISDYKNLVEIQSDVNLLLVEKPAVDPPSTTLFNHHKNQAVLRVVRGSGHFKLDVSEAESKTANITFDELNAYVTVRPKADGRITVKVIDCCVIHEAGSSLPDAEASVRIVDPYEIRVTLNNKIQLGKEAEVTVQVIGTSGDVIESSFHSLMNLHPVLSSDVASIKEIKSSDKKQSVYQIKAEKLGTTGLVFKTGSSTSHLYKKVLESREVKLQIFSPLSVSPASLKLIVGAHFEVTVAGGPPESTLEYSIPDAKTAVVSSSGLIQAVAIGPTSLTVRSIEKDILHSMDKIVVEVVPILGVKIFSPIKQLVSGSEVNLVLHGVGLKSEILDPFAFGSANPKLRVSWTVSNTDILDLSTIGSKMGIHEDNLNSFSVRISGVRDGTAVVRVLVEVIEEANESLKFQLVGNRILADNITIRVSSDLLVNGKNSGHLLLSPGSELNLKSSRDGIDQVIYSVMNGENKVFIDKGTTLKSLTTDAKEAVLLVKTNNAHSFTQLATYGVHVQPISYLMLVPQHPLHVQPDYPKRLVFVPLGASLRFDVNFYNILGQKFDVSNVKPLIRLNRNGLLGYKWITSESQLTLQLTASREGSTIVKIWIPAGVSAGSGEISDFIKITAGQVITPRIEEVAAGSIVCFTSPLTSPEGQAGTWSTDGEDGAFDFITSKSGVAIAQKAGRVKVKHNVTSFSTGTSDILIRENNGLMIENLKVKYLSNQESVTRLPISIRKETGIAGATIGCSASDLKNIPSPFQCSVKFTDKEFLIKASDVLTCAVEFNPERKEFDVVISSNELTAEKKEQVALLESRIEILLQMANTRSVSIPSVPLQLDFLPAFFVHQNEIQLSNHYPVQEIRVSAIDMVLETLTISAVNEVTDSILEVVREEVKDSKANVIGHRFFVQLRERITQVTQSPHSGLQIKLFSRENNQLLLVPVTVTWHLDKGHCIRIASDAIRIDTRTGLEYARDILLMPVNFLIDQHQFLVAVLVVAGSLALVLHQYTKNRPVPVNPNFANSSFPSSGHQPSFTHQSSPGPKNQATVNPYSQNTPYSPRSPFNTTLTQRRIATSDSTADLNQSLFGNNSPQSNSMLYQTDSLSSPRTSTSPKGVVGRPLWTSPRS